MHSCIQKYLGLQHINIKFHGDRHFKCILIYLINSVFNPFGRNNTLFLKLLPFQILHIRIFVSLELIDFILIEFFSSWVFEAISGQILSCLTTLAISQFFIANLFFDKSKIIETHRKEPLSGTAAKHRILLVVPKQRSQEQMPKLSQVQSLVTPSMSFDFNLSYS